jgi:hypothetical protein
MTFDYIFCPLCANDRWLADKTGKFDDARLEKFTCGKCRKFIYINTVKDKQIYNPYDLLIISSDKKRFSTIAHIQRYRISIFHHKQSSLIEDLEDSLKVLLSLEQELTINWYQKEEDIINKIKTYIVFS